MRDLLLSHHIDGQLASQRGPVRNTNELAILNEGDTATDGAEDAVRWLVLYSIELAPTTINVIATPA